MGSLNANGHYRDVEACVDALLDRIGKRIVLAIPLGIGKPSHFVNALYRRAESDSSISLEILTALTLNVPTGSSLLEKRFLEPLAERLYADHVPLLYAEALRQGSLPANIEVSEFYFQPGVYLNTPYAQQRYLCANYSHVARALKDRGVNAVAQLLAKRTADDGATRYSLGSNADMTLDLLAAEPDGSRPAMIGQVSDAMPFMPHDAETGADLWDLVLDDPRYEQPLFAIPNEPVGVTDYAIAIHVASMIRDGGTLQIGIGSLADAVSQTIRLRHVDNSRFRRLVKAMVDNERQSLRQAIPVEADRFDIGLYGCSEMLVEGFMPLVEAGVLKRRVASRRKPDRAASIFLHAGFFVGSERFYRSLRDLPDEVRQGIEMTGVSFVNSLEHDGERKARQRRHARFVNSAMMVTLNGATVSDGFDNGRVVSGVGGQHDFVVMAHTLSEARSIIALPSTRRRAGKTVSNIVYKYGHTTIPRHLRDIVVTEYGAADLRGKTDSEVVAAMLAISDSRFQHDLLQQARTAGKIDSSYRIPDGFRNNTPETVQARIVPDAIDHLPHYPRGTDLNDSEARLAIALGFLKEFAGSRIGVARLLVKRVASAKRHAALLERMELVRPRGFRERLSRRLLLAALELTEDSRSLQPRQP